MGAVVGRDEKAIRENLTHARQQVCNKTVFCRLLLDEMPMQSTMLLLRLCMVPQLDYLVRCTPPSCTAAHATALGCW